MVIPERRFVYRRDDRLDELVGLILAETGRDKRRLRSMTAQLFGSGAGGDLKDPDPRAELLRDLKAVEDYLENKTGEIDEPAAYIHGEIELYMAPFVDVKLPLTKVKQSVAYSPERRRGPSLCSLAPWTTCRPTRPPTRPAGGWHRASWESVRWR